VPCVASWQLEAPLFHFFSTSTQTKGEHEMHTHSSIEQNGIRPRPFPRSARRVAPAPFFNLFFFFLFCNVTFSITLPRSIRFAFFISNSVGKSIHARHGPFFSKSSERRPTGEKGHISLRFAGDAQLRGKRPYHPEGLIFKVYWLGVHRLLYSRSGAYPTSLEM
jgi:hypothetical protein